MNDETIHPDASHPEVLEAQWDHEQVNALFRDLDQGAKILHVQVRATSSNGPKDGLKASPDRAVTLSEAHQLFQDGVTKAIQIRYEFGGQTWCDTLMVEPETVKIIRTELPI